MADLPVRCDCGWVLPAAFQFLTRQWQGKEEEPRIEAGAVVLFACGNCGGWQCVQLSPRGAARTPNAEGFGNMPSPEKCGGLPSGLRKNTGLEEWLQHELPGARVVRTTGDLVLHDWRNMTEGERKAALEGVRALAASLPGRKGRAINVMASFFHFVSAEEAPQASVGQAEGDAVDCLLAAYLLANPEARPSTTRVLELVAWAKRR